MIETFKYLEKKRIGRTISKSKKRNWNKKNVCKFYRRNSKKRT